MRRLVVCFLVLLPFFVSASNAGIVRGLWYSEEVFLVDRTVRIYVAIRNNTGADLSGTVEFFVNGKKIERKNIDSLDGRIIESWADWSPKYGTSTITATLSRTELTSTASGTQAVEVVSALAEDQIFVDFDTDGDGIGNLTDQDDDGDGLSDEEEKKNGTDPLKYDEPAVEEVANEDTTKETKDENGNEEDKRTGSGEPEGLEQFLTPSRANTILTNVTEVVNNTKKKLDDYRTVRHEELNPIPPEEVPVNDDGFGEIERVTKEEQKVEANEPKAEKPGGFFGDLLTFLGNVISGVYTVVLAAFSFALGYPALIQILLLLLILFILYKLAKKFGSRPRD